MDARAALDEFHFTLGRLWAEVRARWRDEPSRRFEDGVWVPVDATCRAARDDLDEFYETLGQARRELADALPAGWDG